tara:strand:+ start:1442 stop:2323 length:882 start_codon:yes stop_codon:yes gene_type:complete
VIVVLEVLFVRPFLKVGFGFLRGGYIPSLYEVIITLSPFILSSSFLLALISVGLVGYLLIKDSSKSAFITSVSLFGFLVLGVFSVFTTPGAVLLIAQNIVAFIVLTLLALWFTKGTTTKLAKIISSLFITSYFIAFWFVFAPAIFILGGPKPVFIVEILNIGEALTIVNALPLYVYFVGLKKENYSHVSELIFPSIPAALFIAIYLLNPALTSLFSTWVFGYNLFLPFPFYVAALWLYADLIIRMLKVKNEMVYGLLFIFIAGRNLESVYLTLLAILGIFLIIQNVHLEKKEY